MISTLIAFTLLWSPKLTDPHPSQWACRSPTCHLKTATGSNQAQGNVYFKFYLSDFNQLFSHFIPPQKARTLLPFFLVRWWWVRTWHLQCDNIIRNDISIQNIASTLSRTLIYSYSAWLSPCSFLQMYLAYISIYTNNFN